MKFELEDTIEESWQKFVNQVLDGMNPEMLQAAKKIFFAGAMTGFMHSTILPDNEAEALKKLERVSKELEIFALITMGFD